MLIMATPVPEGLHMKHTQPHAHAWNMAMLSYLLRLPYPRHSPNISHGVPTTFEYLRKVVFRYRLTFFREEHVMCSLEGAENQGVHTVLYHWLHLHLGREGGRDREKERENWL
jgi:hypothetical protein